MANQTFHLPKATRELPKGIDNQMMANEFIEQAAVSTQKQKEMSIRKPFSSRLPTDMIDRFNALSERCRISKVLLFEEAMADFLKKYNA